MPVRPVIRAGKHDDSTTMYFCTFTCYQWLPLFQEVNGYDMVYNWFDHLKKDEQHPVAFVIMPNHLHVILYFPNAGFDLNEIIGNAKRFMAYEIIKCLKQLGRNNILDSLAEPVSIREKKKGQLHKVFEESFDAKAINNSRFFNQKFNYIHRNPVSGK